jgi:hypothetical protein
MSTTKEQFVVDESGNRECASMSYSSGLPDRMLLDTPSLSQCLNAVRG